MKYMIFEKDRCGNYKISTDIGQKITYIGYSLREAEKRHRERYSLQYKHFVKLYMWDN